MQNFSFKVQDTDYLIHHQDIDDLCICEYVNELGQNKWLVVLDSHDIEATNIYEHSAVVFYDVFLGKVNDELEKKHGEPVEPPEFENETERLKYLIQSKTLFDGDKTLTQDKT